MFGPSTYVALYKSCNHLSEVLSLYLRSVDEEAKALEAPPLRAGAGLGLTPRVRLSPKHLFFFLYYLTSCQYLHIEKIAQEGKTSRIICLRNICHVLGEASME